MNGLKWYKEICSFLNDNECYLITPMIGEKARLLLLNFAPIYSRIRLKIEWKEFGLYISRSGHGKSMIIIKDVFSNFCSINHINIQSLLEEGVILEYNAKMFKDCRHTKNVYKEKKKSDRTKKKQEYREHILNNNSYSKELKTHVKLDIWAEKKINENAISTTRYEECLYNKLYGIYRKRVKRQQRFIINEHVYFVDIFMKAYKVAIEVDGGYHNIPGQIDKDKQKDFDLSTLGLLVIRIKNEDIKKNFCKLTRILDVRHKDILCKNKVPIGTMKL